MLTLPLFLSALILPTLAHPAPNHNRPSTSLSLSTYTDPSPQEYILHVSNFRALISQDTQYAFFSFHDPSPTRPLSGFCYIHSIIDGSIYLDTFKECQNDETDGKPNGGVAFRLSEGELVLIRGWSEGDMYIRGEAAQSTNWVSGRLEDGANKTTVNDETTYVREADWEFIVTEMWTA
ncbi:hypothetical protein M011DRAFT_477264 [Sporormia fimetaria CBS 119925]|uniref:AA1-like domain-containing protein n=1 Tax=Sporormia fimetaria CBS 119925 TaxID=1340428 RepID=A0A6A6VCM6_9PLEO|nr:hypothetical protein M011DRAFT_477264 [Sporormia fimetaria CBS 119925]